MTNKTRELAIEPDVTMDCTKCKAEQRQRLIEEIKNEGLCTIRRHCLLQEGDIYISKDRWQQFKKGE